MLSEVLLFENSNSIIKIDVGRFDFDPDFDFDDMTSS